MTHEELYARLRAETLARHFALSRYTRADHFDQQAFLGTRKRAADDNHNASPGGITWSPPTDPAKGEPLYANPAALIAGLAGGTLPESERWRWAKHDRTNSLMQTGARMVSLAIDLSLGDELALQVLERVVIGLDALFHFKNGPSPFEGYMVRWDVVASDLWETKRGKPGRARLVQNHEFLINADPKTFSGGDHYLYCTPLDDPRYLEAVARHGGLQRGKDRYRRWEPSMDEYIGVLAGYFMVWHTLREENTAFRSPLLPARLNRVNTLLTRVRTQVRRIGRYLKATGFYLVRPHRDFVFRGGIDMNPAFEYPVARVCHRMTGDPMSDFLPTSEATFENAVDMAGYGQDFREFTASLTVDPALSIGDALEQLVVPNAAARTLIRRLLEIAGTLAPAPLGIIAAARFQERLDLVGELDERMQSAAFNYFMNFLARNLPDGSAKVFVGVFHTLVLQAPTTDWAPLVGLTALDDDEDTIVREGYLDWYGNLRQLENLDPFQTDTDDVPPAGFRPEEEIDPGTLRRGFTVAANAVRFLLVPSSATTLAGQLESQLDAMRRTIEDRHHGHLVIGEQGQPGAPEHPVGELHDSARSLYGYMLPLSLCWLHAARGGVPSFANLPLPTPTSMRTWPDPVVPREVVTTSRKRWKGVDFQFPAHAIMRGRLPQGATAYPLFKNPPPRPLDEDLGPPPKPLLAEEFSIPESGTLTDGWPFALPQPPFPFPPPRVRPVVLELRRRVPALPSHLDPQFYRAVADVQVETCAKADYHMKFENDDCIIEVVFYQRTLIPPDIADDRRFKAHVKLSWVRWSD